VKVTLIAKSVSDTVGLENGYELDQQEQQQQQQKRTNFENVCFSVK